MRIKKDFMPLFLLVIAVLCFGLLAPAFADMKKIDETELARTNASVTGATVNNQVASVEKGMANPETWQASETLKVGNAVSSTSATVKESIGLNLNINGQTTFQFYFGASTVNMTGGVTSVNSH